MSNFAPAVEAATRIITWLSQAEQEVGISEISRGTEINKNMVFRILNSLEKEGWVYCNEQKYSLTLLPFRLASKAISRTALNTTALPILYELHDKTGESTYLGIRKADKVLYIQHLDGVKDVRISCRVGGEYDLYCSAPGKVLLAYSEKEFIDEYTARELKKHTENSITERLELQKELEAIRNNGYATDCEEFGYGITCVAAPIFDHTGKVVACVGNSAFTLNHDSQSVIEGLLPHVQKAAKEISNRLGGEHNDVLYVL